MSRVQIIVLGSAVILLLSVLNLVRRRRLREEYSWLWLLTSVSYLLLTISPALYGWVVQLIGATNAALTFTFLGMYFLIFISIQFSVQLSRLVTRSKDLAQEIAILDAEIRRLQELADVEASRLTATALQDNGHDSVELPVTRDAREVGPAPVPAAAPVHLAEAASSPALRTRDHAKRSFD